MLINRENLQKFLTVLSSAFAEGLRGDAMVELARLLATTIPFVGDTWEAGFLKDFPSMRKWLGDKHVKNMEAQVYSLAPEPYEATVGFDRHKLEDQSITGNVASAGTVGRLQAKAAARWFVKLVFDALKNGTTTVGPDGEFFFDTDHPVGASTKSNYDSAGGQQAWYVLDLSQALKPVLFIEREAATIKNLFDMSSERNYMARQLLYGIEARGVCGYGFWQTAYRSHQDLATAANFDNVVKAMMEYTDDEGTPLGIRPTHLVVGTSNRAKARDLIQSERLASGASNPNFREVELVVVPWLP